MLKEAIEKIEEMSKRQVLTIGEDVFLIDGDGRYTQIKPELEMPDPIDLYSLDALVHFVKTDAIPAGLGLVYITVPNHKTASCFTRPLAYYRNQRQHFYTAKATDVPGWEREVRLPFEEAMIALRTRFQPTADAEYALRLLADITTGSKVTYNDNGVATTVVTQKGIALQGNTAIRPILSLRPYRTFQEVEQPESQFLIRISERGITFVEADGGMWKLDARQKVKAYLEDKLRDEVDNGSVVVVM